ncbi:MAG: hypothetical protein PHI12_06900 [Dehalococcoidales bacterium]|nr:hypothetical protein [Dehalococcoidales bacterium]
MAITLVPASGKAGDVLQYSGSLKLPDVPAGFHRMSLVFDNGDILDSGGLNIMPDIPSLTGDQIKAVFRAAFPDTVTPDQNFKLGNAKYKPSDYARTDEILADMPAYEPDQDLILVGLVDCTNYSKILWGKLLEPTDRWADAIFLVTLTWSDDKGSYGHRLVAETDGNTVRMIDLLIPLSSPARKAFSPPSGKALNYLAD